MSISGKIKTMPLAELLQWAGGNRKSGVLRITQDSKISRILFDRGRVAGCASNEHPARLGQFLLSHGRIATDTLERSLAVHERTGRKLGQILIEMGALSPDDLEHYLAAKAEESIYRVFDWQEANFEFEPDAGFDEQMVPLDLQVENVLLDGAKRQDDLTRMKQVFHDPGIVLERTDRRPEGDAIPSELGLRLYDLVDGDRCFADILVESRASVFLATKHLYQLHEAGLIRVADLHSRMPEYGTPAAACRLAADLEARGEYEAALDVLQISRIDHPKNEELRALAARIEGMYLDKLYQSDLPPDGVPVPVDGDDARQVRLRLPANETFVLDQIAADPQQIRTLVRVSPLYEIDLVRALHSLKRKGLIQVSSDAARVESGP